MKKQEFTELIRLSLPTDQNPVLVEKYISIAYDTFVKGFFNNAKTLNDNYTKNYFVPVHRNETTGKYYSIIPARYIKLNRPGSGVINIDTAGSADLNFIPLTDAHYKVINSLTALKIPSYIPFVVIGDRINYFASLLHITDVNIRILQPFEAYLPEEEIEIPEGTELNIRDAVYQLMSQHVIKSNIIDSNEKT